ncbi:MAG: PEP-CTERM sorting domain-containing protein, partial [Tepidisphaeraceae bacterium]
DINGDPEGSPGGEPVTNDELIYQNDGTGFSGLAFGLYENAAGVGAGGSLILTFTADPGYAVTLTSVDLGGYTGNFQLNREGGDPGLTVTGGAIPYASSPTTGNPNTVLFGPGVTGSVLTLIASRTDTIVNVGISNIQFSQSAIPEPASLGMIALGGLGVLARRRR